MDSSMLNSARLLLDQRPVCRQQALVLSQCVPHTKGDVALAKYTPLDSLESDPCLPAHMDELVFAITFLRMRGN